MHSTRRTAFIVAATAFTAGAIAQSQPGITPSPTSQSNSAPEYRDALLQDAATRVSKPAELSGQIQLRFLANSRDTDVDEGLTTGFTTRRGRLKWSGKHKPSDTKYVVAGGFDLGRMGQFVLQDAYLRKDVAKDWELKAGRFRPAFLREQGVSSRRQLLAERSVISDEFGISRGRGLGIEFDRGDWTATATVQDGGGDLIGDDLWTFASRVQWEAKGKGKRFKDFTSWKDGEVAVLVGGGISFIDEDRDGTDNKDAMTTRATVDVSAEFGGSNISAAFVSNSMERPANTDRDQLGFMIQGGVFVAEDIEVVGRFEWGDSDNNEEELTLVTIGVNRYLDKHDAKFTVDLGFALNEVGDTWASTDTGWLLDEAGKDGQILLRTQFQLLF